MRIDPKDMVVDTTNKTIELYVCPTEGCMSAIVAKPGEKLEEEWTGVKVENRHARAMSTGSELSHNRAECPLCRTRGNPVQRIRVKTTIPVPKLGPPTPEPPPVKGTMVPVSIREPEG